MALSKLFKKLKTITGSDKASAKQKQTATKNEPTADTRDTAKPKTPESIKWEAPPQFRTAETNTSTHRLREADIPFSLPIKFEKINVKSKTAYIRGLKKLISGVRRAMQTMEPYVRDAISKIGVSFKSQLAQSRYYPLIGVVFLLVVLLTLLSLFLTYKGTPSEPKAASGYLPSASLSAQLLANTATASATIDNAVDVTWVQNIHNAPGNNLTLINASESTPASTLFVSGNGGDLVYNRLNATEMKATVIGNFALSAKVDMNDPQYGDAEKIFAIQILEYTPDPFSSPFIEMRQTSQRGVSRFSILTEGLGSRINAIEDTTHTPAIVPSYPAASSVLGVAKDFESTATVSAYPAASSVLGVAKDFESTATGGAYLQVQRSSGNILFKTSTDGKTWTTIGQRLINNLTKQVSIRLFLYSPALKTPVGANISDLTLITKNNKQKDMLNPATDDGHKKIIQWAYKARASSDYSNDLWSAKQAIGEPNTESCGDHPTAWASKTANGREWLEVLFQKSVIPSQIRIRESNNPGHIYLVEVRDETSAFTPVWKDTDLTDCNGDLVISLDPSAPRVSAVRISLDETNQNDWNEIDAVSLIGYEE